MNTRQSCLRVSFLKPIVKWRLTGLLFVLFPCLIQDLKSVHARHGFLPWNWDMFSLRSAIADNLITMSCKLNRKSFGVRPLSSAEASLCESEAGKRKKAHGERWEELSVRGRYKKSSCQWREVKAPRLIKFQFVWSKIAYLPILSPLTSILNGNCTEWSPIRSVIIRVIHGRPICLNTSMIIDRIGRHDWVLLPITALFTNMRTLKVKSRLHNYVFRCRQS